MIYLQCHNFVYSMLFIKVLLFSVEKLKKYMLKANFILYGRNVAEYNERGM